MNTEYTNSSNNHNGFSGSSGFQYHRTFSTNPPELDTSNSNPIHIHGTIENPIIRDVWEDNFEEEFRSIMTLIEKYKVVGMDTEFPGIVYRLSKNDLKDITSYGDIEYKTIKMNVDKLKLIQVGISIADEDGYLPAGVTTWQFNFKFDTNKDEFAQDAIDLLTASGIRFDLHCTKGINPQLFAEYLIGSGLALNEDIKWITFHGGFDFAYLIKMLNGQNLPKDDNGFYNLLKIYFPQFYDVKYMVKDIDSLKAGGLSKLASDLNVKRIGPQHQAGSDSLLTLSVYFKLRESYLKNIINERYSNILYGIGNSHDEPNDYVWQTYLPSDYPYLIYNSYPMNNMNTLMTNGYYQSSDPMFGGMGVNPFTLQMNQIYNNYGTANVYMESNKKAKKYDMFMSKNL